MKRNRRTVKRLRNRRRSNKRTYKIGGTRF